MAILFYEHFGWLSDKTDLAKRDWTLSEDNTYLTASVAEGRFEDEQSIQFTKSSNILINTLRGYISRPLTPSSTGIVSLAYYQHGFFTGSLPIIRLTDGGTTYEHIRLYVHSNQTVSYRTSGGDHLQTSQETVPLDTWNRFEIKYYIADTGGYVYVYLNGIKIIEYHGDTRYSAGGQQIALLRLSNPYLTNQGDYVRFTSIMHQSLTPPHDDFLGDVRHYHLPPIADINVTWTPSEGEDNYAVVDETTLDTNDSVSSDTGGAADEYEFDDISGSPQILAVQEHYVASLGGLADVTVSSILKINGQDWEHGDDSPTSGPKVFTHVLNENPTTAGPWSVSDVNSITGGPLAKSSE